jgi:hypothetical protein
MEAAMFQRFLRFVVLASGFLFFLTAPAPAAQNMNWGVPAEKGKDVTVTRGSDGSLVGTLHGGAGAISFEYSNDCNIHKVYEHVPCFNFMGSGPSSGDRPVYMPASGCPHGPTGVPFSVFCPTSGVKSITVVLENGGTASVGSESGATPCSPVPVTVEAHGTEGATVDVKDGCTETVSCLGQGFTEVSADDGDTVNASCSVVTKPSGTNFNFPH